MGSIMISFPIDLITIFFSLLFNLIHTENINKAFQHYFIQIF